MSWTSGLNMNFVEFPCKGCSQRYFGCHTECKMYQTAHTRNDELREIHFRKTVGDVVNQYKHDRKKR